MTVRLMPSIATDPFGTIPESSSEVLRNSIPCLWADLYLTDIGEAVYVPGDDMAVKP